MLTELSVTSSRARITPLLSAWPGTKCPHPPTHDHYFILRLKF